MKGLTRGLPDFVWGTMMKSGPCPVCAAPKGIELDERKAPRGEGPDRIGEILLKADLISREALREALELQAGLGIRLGYILVDRGYVDEDAFAAALADQLGLAYLGLSGYVFDPKVVALLPKDLCEHHRMIPLKVVGNRITVAMADPFNDFARREVERATGLEVRLVVAASSEIMAALGESAAQASEGAAWRDQVKAQLEARRARDAAEAVLLPLKRAR